jgi:VWFA-related protein
MIRSLASSFLIGALTISHALSFTEPRDTNALAQEKKKQDQNEIKLSTELVQIDVLVTDKDNRPVPGLTREDFELYDNNKLQQITNFSFEQSTNRRIEEQPTESHSLPRAIGAGDLKRVMALVVDTLHIKYENIYRTKKLLDDFIDNKMQPGDLVLILPTGGGSGLLQQFTSDRRLLHRAVDRLRPVFFSNDTTPYRTTRSGSVPRIQLGVNKPTAGSPVRRGPVIGEPPDPLEEADVRATLTALGETIKSMKKLPGRKVSVLISEGIRTLKTQTTQDLVRTTGLAANANVVFYTIDPRGLDPLTLSATDEIEAGPDFPTAVANTSDRKSDDFHESQDSLRLIASETGGRFFGDNNDIKQGLDRILDENSTYYMLGFYPEAARWDGKFHKIKVVLRNRRDLTVSFRKGYLAKSSQSDSSAKLDPKAAEAIEAISSPLVRRDLDLRLTPLYADNAQREPFVTLLLHIDATRLTFTQSQGRYQGQLDELGFVLDAQGKTVDRFSNALTLNLRPETHDAVLKRGLVATRTLNVKPGVYQVRLFVRETSSGLIGTANDFLEIPDLKSNRLAVSSIFVSAQAMEDGKIVNTAGEGGTPSQRRFTRNGEFSYWLAVYNAKLDGAAKEPKLEMQSLILRGSKVVYRGEPHPLVAAQGSTPNRIITGGIVRLLKLQPDDYTLQVIIRDKLRANDGRAVVRQEMGFSVE